MDHFEYKEGRLFAEDVAIEDIVQRFGTPCYVYSRATLERHWHAFNDALGDHPHLICYAVKASSNIAILNLFARLGSGFDVVSAGELQRALTAGGSADKIVFSGVGKTREELQQALTLGIHCINVESRSELNHLQSVAEELNITAPVSLRINPNIDAQTHPYISTGLNENKFGIEFERARQLYLNHKNYSHLRFIGMDCHIGSQLTQLSPFLEALDILLGLNDELRANGVTIEHLDLGGGLGVNYHDETPPLPEALASAVKQRLDGRDLKIILEPGRAVAANAGILVTKVEYLKDNNEKHFAIVDAAMNDLIRPALYQAWQTVIPVSQHATGQEQHYDIVGPVCESGDFLAKSRRLSLKEEDLLAVRGAGAYGFSMSSNYNSRPRPPEILVDGGQCHLIRERENIADLYKLEHIIP